MGRRRRKSSGAGTAANAAANAAAAAAAMDTSADAAAAPAPPVPDSDDDSGTGQGWEKVPSAPGSAKASPVLGTATASPVVGAAAASSAAASPASSAKGSPAATAADAPGADSDDDEEAEEEDYEYESDPEAEAAPSAAELAAAEKALGNEAFKTEDYATAVEHYTAALRHTPDAHLLLGNRSAALMMLARDADALADALRSVAIDPAYVKGHLRCGKCFSRLGRLAESKVSYSKAAALEPHNPTIGGELRTVGLMSEHEARADAAKASGDFRGCIEHTQRALALAPEWARMQTLCGEAMLEANVPPGTVASQMSQVLKRQPSNADAFYVRGRALYAMGNLDQAEKHLRQALQYAPDHAACGKWLKLIRALERGKTEGNDAFRTGRHAEAVKLYTAALERLAGASSLGELGLPAFAAMLHANRAAALGKLKRYEEAISDCDRAVSLDPSYHKARLRRAELLLSAGEFDAAVRAFQALKDAGSEDASVRDGLRRAKVALKKSKRKNYYAILGISETATAVQIKKGYRMAALKWHPDKHPEANRDHAEKMFKDVTEANEILSDEQKRSLYDEGYDLDEINNGSAGGGFGGHGHGHGGGFSHEDLFGMFGGMGGGGRGGRGGGGFGGFGF